MHNVKHDDPIRNREQSIVLADQNINTRLDLCSTLANEDVSRKNKLACIALYTLALGIAITSVAG